MLTSDYFDFSGNLIKEPLSISFLLSMIKSGGFSNIRTYVNSKKRLPNSWLVKYKCERLNIELDSIDSLKMKNRERFLSQTDTLDKNIIAKQSAIIEETTKIILENHGEIIFIIPPTLFDNPTGYKELIVFLNKMQKENGIKYYDYSSAITEMNFFWDYDHLNKAGMEYFLKNYLYDVLDDRD